MTVTGTVLTQNMTICHLEQVARFPNGLKAVGFSEGVRLKGNLNRLLEQSEDQNEQSEAACRICFVILEGFEVSSAYVSELVLIEAIARHNTLTLLSYDS